MKVSNREKLYNQLSFLYDKLYSYKDYNTEARFIKQIVRKNIGLNNSNSIFHLDLACGTGRHITALNHLGGFKSIGIDINRGILSIAKENNPNSIFRLGDLSSFQSNKRYTLITCLFSSIQYVLNESTLLKTFKNVHSQLKSGGLFIFDLGYCKERWKENHTVLSTYKDNEYEIILMAQSRSARNISTWNPVIFYKRNHKLDMIIDEHKIRIYSVKYVVRQLEKTGFEVSVFSDFTNKLYSQKQNSVPVIVARKIKFKDDE